MAAERQIGIDAEFDGREPQFFEPPRQVAQRWSLVGDVDQWNAVPEVEGIGETPTGSLGVRGKQRAGLEDLRLEPEGIDTSALDYQRVAG